MNYLHDRKTKKNKPFKLILFAVVIFLLFYFRSAVFNSLSYVSHTVFRPLLTAGNSAGGTLKNLSSFFYSKKTLLAENENLKAQLDQNNALMSNYNSILDENMKMQEILGRKPETTNMLLCAILSKPTKSPYDTLVIDVGKNKNIVVGDMVFALGHVPIGRVAEVYPSTAKVILFSNPGEKTDVVITGRDTFMQATGRGGGNFEVTIPRDFVLEKGTEAHLPGINAYVLGTVASIISDPRDAFTKALLTSPVNIQELNFVEVIK